MANATAFRDPWAKGLCNYRVAVAFIEDGTRISGANWN
jgi:hypothetical protein